MSRTAGVTILGALALTAGQVLAQAGNPPKPPGGAPVPPIITPAQRTPAQDAAAALGRNVSNADIANAIRRSGLSEQQIRDRLTASGFDARLADPFFSVGGIGADQAKAAASGDLALAFRQLGIITPDEGVSPDDTSNSVAASATSNEGLEVFGASVFGPRNSQFDPITSGPVDRTYRLGVGDEVQVVITGQTELAYELQLRRDGGIVLPNVGSVSLAGLTLDAARTVLRQRAGRFYAGIPQGKTDVDISVSRIRANQVYVIGEVRNPGAYQVNALSTILAALARSGGPKATGSYRSIEVRRGGVVAKTFDLYDYLLRGDESNDLRLEQGDVVFVPLGARHVAISGSVRRPAIFELRPNETFKDLLRYAGGFLPNAALNRVQIDRILPPSKRTPGVDRTVIDVRLNGSASALDTVTLLDGDIISVFDVGKTRRNTIDVIGEVNASGTFEWHRGMTIGDAINGAQGFLPWARRDVIKVERLIQTTGQTEVINLNLIGADSAAKFEMEEFDVVNVLDNRTLYPDMNVGISGAVAKPGIQTFVERQTMGDLIDLAGGLREDAQVIELARRSRKLSPSDTAAYIYRFQIKPGRLLDPGARDFSLERGDEVFVRTNPTYRVQRNVTVSGQFAYPGVYVIASDTESVRSLISRAGGLLPQADPNSFRLVRLGRQVPVAYDRVMRNDRQHNIVLYPGDVMQVGQVNSVVTVGGAVERQVAVPYQKGWSLEDYVAAAGGYADKANKSKIVVEYPSGAIGRREHHLKIFKSDPPIQAGSAINVALKPDQASSWKEALTTMVQVSSVVVSLAVGYLAVRK